jgi:hypothetical protein
MTEKCYVCGKNLEPPYIIAYCPYGKQVRRGVPVCDIVCERKLDKIDDRKN